jgi:parallel beta-helix repeat protein
VNFAATGSTTTFSISGTVSPSASGTGTTVRLGGPVSATTTADSSGNYSFAGLASGSYTVVPNKSGFTFSPPNAQATVNGSNVTGVNFAATGSTTTFSISGTISSAANGFGTTVTLGGSASATATANSAGSYSFTGLANGSYTVTPAKNGFTFSPANTQTTVNGANIAGVNFAASINTSGGVSISPGTAIQPVIDANPAGTTFVLQPGLYRLPRPIIPKNGDSFVGQTACAPPATPCPAILSGSTVIGSSATFNGKNYEVTGQTQQGLRQYTTQCDSGWEGCFYPEDLFFDGVPLKHLHSVSLPTIATGQWWFDYSNDIIYFHDNPSGHKVETSVIPTVAHARFGPGPNNVTFQYLTIEEFAAPLAQGAIDPTFAGGGNLNASLNWAVENCELLLNHGLGIHINYGMQILNNYVHNNGQMGIGGGTGSGSVQSGVVLSSNTVTYNNYANVNPAFGAGGIKIGDTLGVVVRGNTVTNNAGAGIHFDADSSSPLIDGNTVTDNIGGIAYEVSLVSALVRNNILQRNGATGVFSGMGGDLQSNDSAGVEGYCNLLALSNLPDDNGFTVVASDRGNNPNSPYQYLTSTGNYFHHNTVIWNSGASGVLGSMQVDPTNQPNFFANNRPPDYNTYHLSSLSAANFLYDNNNSGTNVPKTFAEYQSAGADINGTADTNYLSGFPTVAITSPADQAVVANPVTVAATASDASGIGKVEFYVDWTLQATLSSNPYSFTWTGATAGTHTVAAMAYSNAGVSSCYAVTLNQQ